MGKQEMTARTCRGRVQRRTPLAFIRNGCVESTRTYAPEMITGNAVCEAVAKERMRRSRGCSLRSCPLSRRKSHSLSSEIAYLICSSKIEAFSIQRPHWNISSGRSYSSPPSPPSSSPSPPLPKPVASSPTSPHSIGGLTPKYFSYLVESATPYISSVLQLKLQQISPGNGSLILKCRPELHDNNSQSSLHGGAIVGAIDHSAGFCAWSLVNSYTKIVSTINLEINYLNPLPIDSEGFHFIFLLSLILKHLQSWFARQPSHHMKTISSELISNAGIHRNQFKLLLVCSFSPPPPPFSPSHSPPSLHFSSLSLQCLPSQASPCQCHIWDQSTLRSSNHFILRTNPS
jgi:hypothetical protein